MSKEVMKDLFLSSDSDNSDDSESSPPIPLKRKRKLDSKPKEEKHSKKLAKKILESNIQTQESESKSIKKGDKKVKQPTVVELSDFAPFLHLINNDVISHKKKGKLIALIPIFK